MCVRVHVRVRVCACVCACACACACACTRYRNVTFAEPFIMLSQLHWAYNYGDDPLGSAKMHLRKLLEMHSAKREFFTNLGLLMYSTERDGVRLF